MGFLPIKKFLDQSSRHYKVFCGIDEVGRGPWAGPLVACALILKKDVPIPGCADSKMLTAAQREKLFKKLQTLAVYGVGIVTVEEVDNLGLIAATNKAFVRALKDLADKPDAITPEFLLVDGRDKLQLPHPFKTVIKGDSKIKIIACASIIAKVTRDRMMVDLAKKYPHYAFEDHKGYGTKRHQQALHLHGPCAIHRKSFEPIKKCFTTSS